MRLCSDIYIPYQCNVHNISTYCPVKMQLRRLLSLSTAITTLPIVKAAFVAPTHLVLNPKPTDLINAPLSRNRSNNHM